MAALDLFLVSAGSSSALSRADRSISTELKNIALSVISLGTEMVAFVVFLLFRRGALTFFVYGFAKSGRQNIRRDDLKAFRKLADEMLALGDRELEAAVRNATITEIGRHGKAIS